MTAATFVMQRHPLVLRHVQVRRRQSLSPHMLRIVLGGPELAGFYSPAPDDHVRLFFPNRHGQWVLPELDAQGIQAPADPDPSPCRDYTPRAFDPERLELTVDFVLHGSGLASAWATQAQPGDRMVVAGPRGSSLLQGMATDGLVLIGDETALPAIGRWLETLSAETPVQVLIEIAEAADRLPLACSPATQLQWLERGEQPAGQRLEQAMAQWPLLGQQVFWIACESAVCRRIRLALEARGVPRAQIKAKGYWQLAGDE